MSAQASKTLAFPPLSAHRRELETGLGNRCSVLLSYRGVGSFPRVLRVCGQRRPRRTRNEARFLSAQCGAQSVHAPFRKHLRPRIVADPRARTTRMEVRHG